MSTHSMHYQINLKIIFRTAVFLSLMLPVNAQDLLIANKRKRLSGKFLNFNKKRWECTVQASEISKSLQKCNYKAFLKIKIMYK